MFSALRVAICALKRSQIGDIEKILQSTRTVRVDHSFFKVLDFFVGTLTVPTKFHNCGFNGTSNTSRAIMLYENINLGTVAKIHAKIVCTAQFFQYIFHQL